MTTTAASAEESPSARKGPDWERVEADYRAGLLSTREIAAAQGITEGAIRKRAKRDDWVRDLQAKIKAKADELVRKAEVRAPVRNEREVVEANAQAIADIRVSHRKDIARARSLAMRLLEELEVETDNGALLEQMESAMAGQEGTEGLRRAFQRVVSTSGRIDNAKKLAEALKVLIGLEREAYNIAEVAKIEHSGKNGGPLEIVHMTPDAIRAVMAQDDC